MSHVSTVQAIYAAFGRGDVPAILEALTPDVEWEYGGTPEVPWLQPRRGREGVGGFFRALVELTEITRFDVKQVVAGDGGLVLAVIDLDMRVKPTGKLIHEVDEVHLWHFDAKGQVHKFRHRADTSQHVSAYRG